MRSPPNQSRLLLEVKKLIHRSGSSFAVSHGEDHRRRTTDDIASGEYPWDTGHAVIVHHDVAPLVELKLGAGGGE